MWSEKYAVEKKWGKRLDGCDGGMRKECGGVSSREIGWVSWEDEGKRGKSLRRNFQGKEIGGVSACRHFN